MWQPNHLPVACECCGLARDFRPRVVADSVHRLAQAYFALDRVSASVPCAEGVVEAQEEWVRLVRQRLLVAITESDQPSTPAAG